MPTLLRGSTPTARKAHRCYTCRGNITPGEKYNRSVYLGDDGLYEWVACLPCNALTPVVWDWAGRPDEGVTDEEFIEWARESPNDLAAIAFLTRIGVDR